MSEKFRIFATVIRLLAEFSEDEENKNTRIQENKTIDMKTIKCPKCGRETAFEPGRDAIDEDGEVYRCRQCGWPFWWRGKSVVGRSDKF